MISLLWFGKGIRTSSLFVAQDLRLSRFGFNLYMKFLKTTVK